MILDPMSRSRWVRWIAYALPWIAVVVLLGAYFFHEATRHDLERARAVAETNVRLATDSLKGSLRQVASDLFVLAGAAEFEEVLAGVEPGAVAHLAREYLNFGRSRRIYDQVRWIDESGMQRVRVDAGVRGATVVPASALQNEADRDYFAAAMALQPFELYLSPLDLDAERGAIEQPFKPMLRLATPVIDPQGRRRGIVVLNYLADDMLERFRMVMEPGEHRGMLLNRDGFWLASPIRADEWGFMRGARESFATRHPGAWERIRRSPRGQFEDADGVWTYDSVFALLEVGKSAPPVAAGFVPSRGVDEERRFQWKVVTLLPRAEVEAIRVRHLPQALAVSGVAILIILFGSWRLVGAMARQADAEERLRKANAGLERTVADRTQQLRSEVAERQRAEQRHREQSEQYQRILATMQDAYWLTDRAGAFLDVNPAACAMLGYCREELLALGIADVDALDSAEEVAARIARIGATGFDRFETRHRRKDGSLIDVEVSASLLSELMGTVVLVRDISERKKVEAERRLAALVVENTDEGVVVCGPDLRIRTVNPAFAQITGYAAEAIVGRSPAILGLTRPGTALEVLVGEVLSGLARQGSWRGEVMSRRADGEIYPAWVNVSVVRDAREAAELYVAVFSDITMIKQSQERINYLAHHDALTGLPNRLLFQARLEHGVERARRDGRGLAVLFIDLDRFKDVNDTLGHAAGDRLLRDLASAMGDCLRGEDTLARLGGDEFTILLEDTGERESAATVVAKLERTFPWNVVAADRVIAVTASIGIALYPDDGSDADRLVARADVAMYAAKEAGRGCHRYAADLDDQPDSAAP